jgi:hypothetical protein
MSENNVPNIVYPLILLYGRGEQLTQSGLALQSTFISTFFRYYFLYIYFIWHVKGTVSRDWIGSCIVLMDRPLQAHVWRRFSDFFDEVFIF